MGTLYVCGTPIGNLEDISLRVLRILREADCIAAEDTRHTLKLLNFYNITTPLTSYHEHNAHEKGPDLLRQLKQDRNIALVSDAGMPCISDPGAALVKLCLDECIPVVVVPGPSALVTALAISGTDTDRFVFEGFLPQKNKKRREILNELRGETRTIVIYEAPHHLRETLADLEQVLCNRFAILTRELTKSHEEIERGTLRDLIEQYTKKEPIGEYVIVIEATGCQSPAEPDMSVQEHVAFYTAKGFTDMEAIKQTAKDRGIGKREIYNAIKIKDPG